MGIRDHLISRLNRDPNLKRCCVEVHPLIITALKMHYFDSDTPGVIEIVPTKADYFDDRVRVEKADPFLFNNIALQNACRVFKTCFKRCEPCLRSYHMEQIVRGCALNKESRASDDAHGLALFHRALESVATGQCTEHLGADAAALSVELLAARLLA